MLDAICDIRRVNERDDKLSDDIIKDHYMNFYNNFLHILNQKARVIEIQIETDHRDVESVSDEILSALKIL
jgi:hypothetical protein